ncbi:MAG: phosphoribosylanthranilate isomerase [Lysobacterales bacterium]
MKICGLTRARDVKCAVLCGADAVGFVFADSPRRIDVSHAEELAGLVPVSVLRVGLFLDQDAAFIEAVLEAVALDVLQFHGRESEAQCARYGRPWLKAVAMQDGDSLQRALDDYPGAMGLLLDSHEAGRRGGSGKTFDWSLAQAANKPLWLAGGLNAGNVGAAMAAVSPFAVDVSSGVEAAPGIKDAGKIEAFCAAVRRADATAGIE